MRTRSLHVPVAGRRLLGLVAVAFLAASCGSGDEGLAGTYGTAAVQREPQGMEAEVFGADLVARTDRYDQEEAVAEGEVWARLRLEPSGRFTLDAPLDPEDEQIQRISGRWEAIPGGARLRVEKGADLLPEGTRQPLEVHGTRGLGLQAAFLLHPRTKRPVQLDAR